MSQLSPGHTAAFSAENQVNNNMSFTWMQENKRIMDRCVTTAKPMSGLGSQQQCWKKRQKLRDKASCHVDGREWQHLILSENMISQFNFTKLPLALETNMQCRREHTRFGGGGVKLQLPVSRKVSWCPVTATATSVALGVKWFEEHFTVCQGIQITTKVLLIPVPRPPAEKISFGQRMKFFFTKGSPVKDTDHLCYQQRPIWNTFDYWKPFQHQRTDERNSWRNEKKHAFKMSSFSGFCMFKYHVCAGVDCVWVMASWLLVAEQISARLSGTDRIWIF